MATAQAPIGRVTALHGQAFVRTPDGQQHELKLNDVVHEGDVIVTSAGGDVELSFGSGKTYSIHGSETATLDAAVFASEIPTPADAALVTDGTQINGITNAIASGNSLDTLLEETAAGLTGGGNGSDGSHSFVQLLRVAESLGSPDGHQFDPAALSGGPAQQNGAPLGVQAPTIAIDPLSGDNLINGADAAKTIAVTGVAGGGAQTGDVVTITVNGTAFTGVVAADHTYSVNVPGADLAAATSLTATITSASGTADASLPYAVDTTASASITINSITADNIVNGAEAAGNINVTGTVGGDAKAGDTVTLTVNGHDYTGTVQAGNTYAIAVSGSDLAADSNVHGSVTATDAAGNTATATADHGYVADTTATATITIDSITADNVINAKEAAGNVSVTGTVGGDVKVGDTLTLTINGHEYTGTVQEGNTYSISVKGSDLADGTNVHASVTATDNVGNTATATADLGYAVDTSATATITINSITADNVINAAEASHNVSVTGQVGGDVKAGDTVTLTVNGHDYTGTVTANSTYSISVSGSDLATGSSVHASVTATDAAGNTATATADHGYGVNTEASAGITINSVTSDNIIDSKEADSNVTITGKVSGDAKAGDTVTLTVDGHAYTGTVQVGGGYAISVAGSDLAASTNVHASVTATDSVGNTVTATANHAYSVSLETTPASASISVDSITADNVINASEAAGNVNVTGTVGGDAKAGDTVTLTVNGQTYTGTVHEGDTFAISVAGSDLAASTNVHASVTATNSDGNTATATTDHAYSVATSATASITVDAITADNVINAAEAAGNVSVTGTVGGDAKAGDTVTLTVNGQHYTGTVQEGDTYSISVKGSDLSADSSVHASVAATDTAGNATTATADHAYSVTTSATASITVDAITADNVINATEAAGNVNVTGTTGGEAKAGDTVTLTVNGQEYTGTVQADGGYSISVAGSDLAAASSVHASVTTTDTAGNTATATMTHGYTVDTTATATIAINAITADNVVNAAEATGNVSVTGTVGGDVKAGDTVTLTVNGQEYTGAVHEGSTFSISVKGSDLAADSSVHASVAGTDAAGNTATATADHGYSVDTTIAASVTVDAVTADNIINAAEAAGNVSVTGTVGDDVKAGDTVTLTVNGQAYTGAVQEGGTYSISVAGSDLAAASSVHASVTTTDAAGNSATATADHAYSVATLATASITVDLITSDNVVNATEAAGNVSVTGTVGGDAKAGDTVTLTVNGQHYTGTVQEGDIYSISVKGSDLSADSSVHASVAATDAAGNSATAAVDHAYTVDTSAIASITVNAITADNVVNATEAAGNINVTGTAGGDVKAGDTVTLTVNGQDYTGTVHGDNTYSISVKGSDLSADSSVHASVAAKDAAGNTTTATADHAYTVDTTATASITINAITADNVINAAEAAGNVNVTGTAGGDAKAGDTVTLTVNGQEYTGAVQAGGGYSISVAGSDLAAASSVHASVTATDAAGNTATATADHGYTVDTTIAASITVNAITADNIINAAEAVGNVNVTGTAGGDVKAGDTVTLTVNGQAYTGAVQEGGTYSISVAGSDLAASSSVHASVTTTDAAGNTATATADHGYTVDTSATASITVDAITVDNVINAAEAAGNINVTGTAGGDAKTGDTVTLTVNGQTYTGAVQAGGGYSISVAGSDLAAASSVHASVTATDAAGNTATATADHGYTVDTSATASITINAITADNIVNATEAAGNVSVTGTAGGDAKVGDTVTLTVNGQSYTGAVQAGGGYSISVAGSDLAAASSVHASVTATDAAGNTATATADHGYTVDTSATASITVDSITADNVINATEAAGNINVTGTAGGDVKAGDTVTLTINGQTYTGTVAADDTYSISVKGSDLAAVSNVHASVTTTDAAGNTATATADHAYNNAPAVATTSATVSEEGLSGGNLDTTGSPSDTTNSASATGTVAITDVDSHAFLVTLAAPTSVITSNGVALTWTGDGTGTLVGKAGSTTIMTIGIDNTGAYTVTLSGPVDHPDKTAEDVMSFNVGVVVNDNAGGVTNSTIAVNVEDDSPVWTAASNNAVIEATIGAELTGNLNLSIGADSGSHEKVVFTGANLDSSGNIMATNGQYVTYNDMKLHYVDSDGALTAVASDGTHVYTIAGDPVSGQYNMTMLHTLDSTVSQTATFNAVQGGNNNVYTLTDTGNLYGITITATQNGVSTSVNTNATQFGVANNFIDSGESLKFVFDAGMKGMNVTLDGTKFNANDHATYTVHYTDGTTGNGTIDGNAAGSVTVDLSFAKNIDTITFNGTTDAYRLTLHSITGTSLKVDQSIQVNAAGVDADGDTTSSHLITATLNYDGSLVATTSGSAMGGGAAAESIVGSSGDDILTGGAGGDTMTGGFGADTFAWHLADKGTAGTPTIDKVTDFGTAAYTAGGSGDRLDLRDLLQNENHTTGTGNLTNYLHFEKSGSDTIVHISSGGGFTNGVYAAGAEDQRVVMSNVDLAALYNTNSDAVIIQNLLANHKLVTD